MKQLINPKYSNDKALMQLICRLPEAFEAGEGELIYDGRNQLRRFVLPSGLVAIVKAYRRPNLFQRICYSTFWSNKAIKSFRFAARLLQLDIDTPEAMAAITYYNYGGLVSRYYLVTTEDSRPDCTVLRDGHIEHPQVLIDALTAFIARMHEAGFLHGDTNLSNFLYEPQPDGGFKFSVIDINRSRFLTRPAHEEEAYHNLMRLTHVRPLLCALVRSYAHQRGWDTEKAEHTVLDLIARRERKKAIIHQFTHFFK